MGRVRNYTNQMAHEVPKHHFSGEGPVMVVDFVTGSVREANIREICEAQVFVDLLSLLKGCTESKHGTVAKIVFPEEGDMSD